MKRLLLVPGLFLSLVSCQMPPDRGASSTMSTQVTEQGSTRERYTVITYEREHKGPVSSVEDEEPLVLTNPTPTPSLPSPDSSGAGCVSFDLPASKPLPPIPTFTVAEQREPCRVCDALVEHIEKLRNYARQRDKAVEGAYLEYHKKCTQPKDTPPL